MDPSSTLDPAGTLVVRTPFGDLVLVEEDGFLTEIRLPAPSPAHRSLADGPSIHDESPPRRKSPLGPPPARGGHAGVAPAGLLGEAERQLQAYFAGERRAFDLPVMMRGTAFQRRVWEELTEIPYGETWSYGELARRVGAPDAARAVGQALHHNPVPIVVPCHRVVGARGELTGFGGGIDMKRRLLRLEGWRSPRESQLALESWTAQGLEAR
jgi:methylated-DNA-[protein]-cysteine S-methyltransferase